MRIFEVDGDSPAEILNQFMVQKNVPKEYIEMEIIAPGSKGILGFGRKPAKVLIKYNDYEYLKRKLKLYFSDVLAKAGFENFTLEVRDNKPEFIINIHSEESNLLIGKSATTLDSLQYLADRIIKSEDTEVVAVIDVDNYRTRVVEPMKEKALKLANSVKKNGRPAKMSPMATFVRREIHMVAKSIPGVTTISHGDGQVKSITIISEKKSSRPPRSNNYRGGNRNNKSVNRPAEKKES